MFIQPLKIKFKIIITKNSENFIKQTEQNTFEVRNTRMKLTHIHHIFDNETICHTKRHIKYDIDFKLVT